MSGFSGPVCDYRSNPILFMDGMRKTYSMMTGLGLIEASVTQKSADHTHKKDSRLSKEKQLQDAEHLGNKRKRHEFDVPLSDKTTLTEKVPQRKSLNYSPERQRIHGPKATQEEIQLKGNFCSERKICNVMKWHCKIQSKNPSPIISQQRITNNIGTQIQYVGQMFFEFQVCVLFILASLGLSILSGSKYAHWIVVE